MVGASAATSAQPPLALGGLRQSAQGAATNAVQIAEEMMRQGLK
jgi:hypothetical protein